MSRNSTRFKTIIRTMSTSPPPGYEKATSNSYSLAEVRKMLLKHRPDSDTSIRPVTTWILLELLENFWREYAPKGHKLLSIEVYDRKRE